MLATWIDRISVIKEKYINEFSGLTLVRLNWKVSEASWSISQCIDHVITTNERYFPIIEKINQGVYQRYWTSYIPFVPGLFGRMILNSVKPETIHRKNKTFPVFEPTVSQRDDTILTRFKANQIKLKAYLNEINPANYDNIISSPVNNFIVYPLHQAVEIIIAHEERHFLQAKRIKEAMPATIQ